MENQEPADFTITWPLARNEPNEDAVIEGSRSIQRLYLDDSIEFSDHDGPGRQRGELDRQLSGVWQSA